MDFPWKSSGLDQINSYLSIQSDLILKIMLNSRIPTQVLMEGRRGFLARFR
jgi:hypothetical protein